MHLKKNIPDELQYITRYIISQFTYADNISENTVHFIKKFYMQEKNTFRSSQSVMIAIISIVTIVLIISIQDIFSGSSARCLSGNCRDGEGEAVYPDGSMYCGSFHNGIKNGMGSIHYPDGSVFSGGWANDMKNGEGRSLFSDGSEYKGLFKNGMPHGEGIFIASDGIVKKVRFNEGILISSSAIAFKKVEGFMRYGTVLALGGVYTGWYSGVRATGFIPERRGRIRWEHGSSYAGQWHNGKMHGRGAMRWPDGSSYVGEWNFGRRSGFGTYTWKTGSTYMGGWKDNRKHGPGIAVYADGKIQCGLFFEDTFLDTPY